MKTLKVKSILFSFLAMMAVAVFMTSCERENIVGEDEGWRTLPLDNNQYRSITCEPGDICIGGVYPDLYIGVYNEDCECIFLLDCVPGTICQGDGYIGVYDEDCKCVIEADCVPGTSCDGGGPKGSTYVYNADCECISIIIHEPEHAEPIRF